MKEVLERIFSGSALNRAESREVGRLLLSGAVNPSQVAAFLGALRMRAVHLDELLGLRDAMMERAVRCALPAQTLVDLCGTGGDGKNTFNISTAAAFVVAARGVSVAKHGNYSASSACGSSNVMEALAVPFLTAEAELSEQLSLAGFCYFHAPLFHGALKAVAPIRKDLGVRTIFNLLGPLANPAGPSHQLVGVPSLEIGRLYANALRELGIDFAVVHSLDGYDEVSLTGLTRVFTREGDEELEPGDFGLEAVAAADLAGFEAPAAAAAGLRQLLAGEGSPAHRAVVAANAGLALWLCRGKKNLKECVKEAHEALRSGAAAAVLGKVSKSL